MKNTRVTSLVSLPVLICFLPHGVQGGESAKEAPGQNQGCHEFYATKKRHLSQCLALTHTLVVFGLHSKVLLNGLGLGIYILKRIHDICNLLIEGTCEG